MTPWKEVENSQTYQALPPIEQQKAKEQYFNEVVAPQIPAQDLDIARTQFFGETAPIEKQPTIPAMSALPKVPQGKGITLKDAALWAGEQVAGAGETALSLTTGAIAWPISKVAGAAKMATSGAEEARKTESQVAEYLTYKPYTKAGKGSVGLVGKGFEKLMWPAKKAGEVVEKATGSKELGYAAEFGAELLTLKGLHAGGQKIKAKVRKPMPGEPGYRTVKGELEKARRAELVEKLQKGKPEKPLARLKKAEGKIRLAEESKQGFISEPKVVKLRKAPEYYPKGAEYVAGKQTEASVEYKPVISKKGTPFKTKQQANFALKQKGLNPNVYDVIKHKSGYAIRRKAEVSLADKYATLSTKKGAETIEGRIRELGGISSKDLPGEVKRFRESGFSRLINQKKGVPLDVMEDRLQREGWLRPGEDLIETLSTKRGKIYQDTTLYNREVKKMAREERTEAIKELEGKGAPTVVGELNLKRGDMLKSGVKGYVDTYQVKGRDKAGNFILKNGETIKVDEFDRLPVIGDVKRATKKSVKEIKQARLEKSPLGSRIVDEVRQPVDLALMAAKKGKSDLVAKMAEKARKNAETLRLVDGPKTEKLINQELSRLPKEQQPSPSTVNVDFLGMQSMYEKALEKIRGIRKPKLVRPTVLKEGKARLAEKPKELKPGESLRTHVESLDEPLSGKTLKEKAIRTRQGLAEEALSPETVYKRDPDAGTKIYKIMDKADIEKNKFLANEGEKFVRAAGKIKQDSVSASRVGAALDGKINRSELKPNETKLYDFLKDRFDFLIRYYARSRAGSEAAHKQVVNWANAEVKPMVKVESLSDYKQSRYNSMRKKLAEVRGGVKKDALNKSKRKQYEQIKRNMREYLHKEWLDRLPEGQREAYTALTRRIKDYLPHIFDKEQLLAEFKADVTRINNRLKTATNPGAITRYKKRLRELQDAIIGIEQGKLVTYQALPKNIRFKFFETRKGAKGYSFDAVKAYQAYLTGIARKIYDEPAIRMAAELHNQLDPSLKAYNKWFIRDYMGWNKSKLDTLSGAIASAQWMRTLGFNPRSAIVNFTQRLNTIVEVGEKYSLKGEAFGFTKNGKKLFDETGIAREVPQVLMEGPVPEGMERIRSIAGYMFNKMELGNRKHAFLSGYLKAKNLGMSEKAAIKYGIDVVHKTQFRYGKIGMPRMLRRPVGRLAGQFMSYTIKEVELLGSWLKNNPKKFIKFVAYAEGINYTLKEFLDTDLSNAFGFGITWGEIMNALKDMTEADWRGFWRHLKLSVSGGGGILPSGLGPTVTGAAKVIEKMEEGKGFEQLKKELTPVQLKRFMDAYKSVVGKNKEGYPVYDRNKHVMYYLTAPQLVRKTIGPRTAKESKEWLKYQKETLLEQERQGVLDDIKKAIVDGDTETARELVKRYKVMPTMDSIITEKLRRKYPRKKVEQFKRKGRIGKREEYQFQREEEILR